MIIYQILNKNTGKIYIGKTQQKFHDRLLMHFREALQGCNNFYFHQSIRKHGKTAFIGRVLFRTDDPGKLAAMETYYIQRFNSIDPSIGYNMTDNSQGGFLCDEARRKISITHKGRIKSQQERYNISESHKGRKYSEESRKKMSESHRGRKLPETQKRKIAAALKGKPRSEETKRKISEKLKGRVLSKGHTGKKHSESTKQKMSVDRKGKKHSEDTREKMRISQARRRRREAQMGKMGFDPEEMMNV